MLWFVLLLLGVGTAASDASEPALSRPYWTGRIEQDTTWRDTVYVGGDVTIAAAATLTLAPKTKVLFLPYRDDARGGLDSTRAELIVEGRLAAHAGGIVFRSADAGSLGADWYGLVVERGGRADVSHAAIRDGLRCLYAKMGGFVTMDAIAFANCGKPTAPEDVAKPTTSKGTERKEELGLVHQRETKITPPMNQPFETQEIAIHIRAEHKEVISALLAAADEGTTVTGIVELDSLAATYGLMGYGTGRSSVFYGSRFRLTFPPGADEAAMAEAYWNVPYIQSGRQRTKLAGRVAGKLFVGTLMGSAVLVGSAIGGAFDVALFVGCPVGVGLGTSLLDRHDYPRSLVFSIGGSFLGVWIGAALIPIDPWVPMSGTFMQLIIQPITATLASELFRKPPASDRFSVGLMPDARGNWSARATLRF